jgi:tripartite-type tricarboxylate transporter receptor subunit TctC
MAGTRRQFLGALAAASAIGPWASRPAFAAAYPDHPVKLIVPYPAGGVVDIAARIVADNVAASWGQAVIVDNRPGANGNIGADAVKNAKADGYTLLAGSMFVVINPLIDKAAHFAAQDFEPIASIGASPNLLVVPASSPARTLKEFVALARRNPGAFNTPNPGVGSSNHLGLELFLQASGTDLVQVNYKGQPSFMVDLINGQLHFALVTSALALPHFASGKLRALAVGSNQRLKALPEVPTLDEAGYPNAAVLPWNALFAPAGTPRPVIDRIAAEVDKALRSTVALQRYDAINAEIPPAPLAFPRFLEAEKVRWKKIVAERKITAEAF